MLGIYLSLWTRGYAPSGPVSVSYILAENSDFITAENGDRLITE